jgi:hypothetical protein
MSKQEGLGRPNRLFSFGKTRKTKKMEDFGETQTHRKVLS